MEEGYKIYRYTVDIPSGMQVIEDENEFYGYSEYINYGSNGTVEKVLKVELGEYNMVRSVEELETTVIEEPEDAVVVIGVKPREDGVRVEDTFKEESINPEYVYIYDDDLYEDETVNVQRGVSGRKEVREITTPDLDFWDGYNYFNMQVGETVIEPAIDEVIVQGTKPREEDEHYYVLVEDVDYDWANVVYEDDPDSYMGEEEVIVQGEDGEYVTYYIVEMVNGEPVGEREYLYGEWRVEKRDTVIRRGVKPLRTEEVEVTEVEIPFETEIEYNDKWYDDESYVIVEGVKGLKRITTTTNYYKGEPEGEPYVEEQVLREPIKEVVRVGTKPRETGEGVEEFIAYYDLGKNYEEVMLEARIHSKDNYVGAENGVRLILKNSEKREQVIVTMNIGERGKGSSMLGRDSLKVEARNIHQDIEEVVDLSSTGYEDFTWDIRVERLGRYLKVKAWKTIEDTGEVVENTSVILDGGEKKLYANGTIRYAEVVFISYNGVPYTETSISKFDCYGITNGDKGETDLIKSGNVLDINSKERRVSKDGEPMGDKKDPQTKYIKLGRGRNELQVLPRGAYKGVVEYREGKL